MEIAHLNNRQWYAKSKATTQYMQIQDTFVQFAPI